MGNSMLAEHYTDLILDSTYSIHHRIRIHMYFRK